MSNQSDLFQEKRGVSPCIYLGERCIFIKYKNTEIATITRPRSKGDLTKYINVKASEIELLDSWRVTMFDTETDGLPKKDENKKTVWPHLVEIAYEIIEVDCETLESKTVSANDFIVTPDGFEIPPQVEKVHGMSTAQAMLLGIPLGMALSKFSVASNSSDLVIAHNINFDKNVVGGEMIRIGDLAPKMFEIPKACSMQKSRQFCGLGKNPKMNELYQKIFKKSFEGQHRAKEDTHALTECVQVLIKKKIIQIEKEVT